MPFEPPAPRLIEENFWRAIRYGLDGKLIDLDRARGVPGRGARRTGCWPGPRPARAALGIDLALPAENGAQRQRRALAGGASIEEVFAAEVAETQRTYAARGGERVSEPRARQLPRSSCARS